MATGSTRERLIAAAGELFYERGFQAVGLDQILDAVGITKTAFYKHFESKDELIVAVLHASDRDQVRRIEEFVHARGNGDAARGILAIFQMLDEWFIEPGFRGCLFLNAMTEFPSEHDPIHRAAREYDAHLSTILERLAHAAGAPDPAALAAQLNLLITGAVSARHREGKADAARTAGAVARVLVDAARGPA